MKRSVHMEHSEISGGVFELKSDGRIALHGGQEEISLLLNGRPGAPDGDLIKPARYLVLDLFNPQMTCENLFVRFFESGMTKFTTELTLMLMANFEARAVFDLQAVNAQRTFLPLFPMTLKAMAHGDSADLERVDRISIGLARGYAPARSLSINAAYFTDENPEPLPQKRANADRLGQWKDREWPGKIADEEALRAALQKEEKSYSGRFPAGFSRFGGLLSQRYEKTGYFHTVKDAGRWMLVDPDGCAFFSTGVFGVYPGEPCWILGNEACHEYIPDQDGEYKEAFERAEDMELYRRKYSGMFPKDTKLYSFATGNLISAFGRDWRARWTSLTAARLRSFGVNTLSMFSDEQFISQSQMPYVIMLKGFPVTRETIFREFPDVFSDEYEQACSSFAKQLIKLRQDRFLVGYFLNNEPTWGFLNDLNMAEKLLETDRPTASRQALISALRQIYKDDISALSRAWNTEFKQFSDLMKPLPHASRLSPRAESDLRAFTGELYARYAELPSRYAKIADPNHLNLGMRFAGLQNAALLKTADYFDVFSFNCYEDTPDRPIELLLKAGVDQPMMIGEFHFGALDRGLPHPSLFAVASQKERAVAYQRYVGRAAAQPNVVGAHYFAYNDQPLWGRYDGENYQFGFVDVCNMPHREFVEGVCALNSQIYDLKAGIISPLGGHTEKI